MPFGNVSQYAADPLASMETRSDDDALKWSRSVATEKGSHGEGLKSWLWTDCRFPFHPHVQHVRTAQGSNTHDSRHQVKELKPRHGGHVDFWLTGREYGFLSRLDWCVPS